MPAFANRYRRLYDRFGYPLGVTHAADTSALDKVAERLHTSLPTALYEYYAVAGNERRFNRSLQTFLAPSRWFLNQRHLVFIEENQAACWWGVSMNSRGAKDPMVSQGVNHDDAIEWHKVHNKCSTFISVLLHYQAVSDGFRFCGSCTAPDDAHEKMKSSGWEYAGEVNQLWAFNRQNQAVCIMPGGGLPYMPAMMVMAGGKTAADLESIGDSLGVNLN